jgi:hypothetical protein
MLVLRERFNDVWGRTSTDEKMSSISYDTYLFQVKRVDEMFVIILINDIFKFICL